MSQLKTYYFDLFHHDVDPIVKSSSLWGVQGEYVIDDEHVGYTNWISLDGDLQSVIPNGADTVMLINTSAIIALDVDVVANSVELGEEAALTISDDRSMQIVDTFVLNGLVSVNNNHSLTNGADTALLLTGAGTLNLSGDGTSGVLGTKDNRNTFAIGQDLTITTRGYSTGYIYANLVNAGTITTGAGSLTLNGNAIENTGSIVTGGKLISLENATVTGTGTLNGANGEVRLNGTTVNNGTLTGYVRTTGADCTLNRVTVDADGELDIQGPVVAQDTLAIEGTIKVQNNTSLFNASAETVTLTGTGTLNLSGDGTSGFLGTDERRNSFTIGKDLTVTTLGYSTGYIFANLVNAGTITSQAGNLTLNGNAIENTGTIAAGGKKSVTLAGANVSGAGTLNGADGIVYLTGSTFDGSVLKGQVQATDAQSTLKNVTVDADGVFTANGDVALRESFIIQGTATVQNNKTLSTASAEPVVLTGTGTLNLSGDGTSGFLGSKEERNTFSIAKDLSLTTKGYSTGYIYADLANAGVITTEAGNLSVIGSTIANSGSIVTGGKLIALENATVTGTGTLNGANGEIQLNGATVNNGTLTGYLKTTGEDTTLKQVNVDADGTLDIQGAVVAQESLAIDGKVIVQNNKSLSNASAESVALTGTGTLSMSGNGTSGFLGTKDSRNAFAIGKDITVTTLGYSTGYIYADLTNAGVITTKAGNLTLNGNTIANTGVIATGGKLIALENATVTGSGTLNGANGEIQLNGTTVNNVTLTGYIRATGSAATTIDQVKVDANGTLDIQADVLAKESLAIEGKVTVQNNRSLYSTSEGAVALTGTGTLNLSGNGTSGVLGTEDNRNAFAIGKDITVTTLGYSTGYIYADLANEGTITTESGNLILNGSSIANAGSIVTGGNKSITLKDATLGGSGTLNGKKGTIYLNASTLDGAILKGQVQATSAKSALKDVTVDVDGKFTANADVALRGSFAINGMASVQNNCHLVNESAETPVKLTGIGTLNLSGNGTSGTLGGKDAPGGFELGEGLTLTTFGYSAGYITADLKNDGLITTSQGTLGISGCAIENNGTIKTGGKSISVSAATITGSGTLDGANGTISLENTTLDGAVLSGALQAQAGTALNGVRVTADGSLDVIGQSSTNGIRIDGALTVYNNVKLTSAGDGEVALTGTGTIGLSGNGTSGILGDANSKFSIAKGLTLTTPGYSRGYISADVTNQGEIVTGQGELSIAGTDDDQLVFRNAGSILTGGKSISFARTTVDNSGGSIVGANGTVSIGTGAAVTGGTLGGRMQVSGDGASVVLGEGDCIRDGKITVSSNGSFTARNILAQANFTVENGTLALTNVALAGTINAAGNPKQVTLAGVGGDFELILNTSHAARYTIIGNDFTNAVVRIQGGGNLDLSGNYWGGLTDEDEIRAKYGLGGSVNVSNALTVAPEGNALFLTGADLANEQYLSLAQTGLKVSFLSQLDPESVTEQSVMLWDDTAEEQVSLADRLPVVQDRQLVFDDALFEDGHSYRVVFTDDIRSTDGYALNTGFQDTVAFTVDRTAPKVLDIEKTVNLTGKLPDFRITFSSEIDVSTLGKALKVTSPDGQNIGVEVSMLTEGVALVTSKSEINVPGEYAVTIDAEQLVDKAGNHLQESFAGAIDMTRINLDVKELAVSKDAVTQGETFMVQWKTFNLEEADLYGKWTDGVYLSQDDIWDNSDTLLASVVHRGGLPRDTSVSGQAQVSLSGVVDGDYYLLVRPDIYNEKPTGASERNVQSIGISVSTNAMPEGAQTIHPGQSATYKFTAGPGSYLVSLDTLNEDYNGMELYIGCGYAPTRENYDTVVRNANDAQLGVASRNYDQDIYVMVYARNSGGKIGYTLTAERVGLEIRSVTPGVRSLSDGQPLTFVVEGLCFTPETTIVAVDAAEQTIDGFVSYVSDHQLLVSFAPGQLAEGDYVLKAADGEAIATSETVTLTTGGAPNLEVTADLPQMIGNHYITSFDVNYANTGDASMGAVLLTVSIYEVDAEGRKTRSVGIMGVNKSMDQNHKAYNGSYSALPTGYVSTAAIYAQGKVPGQLEPGASGSVTIDLVGLLQPWNVNGNNNLLWEINYFDENSEEPLDWRELMPGNSEAFYRAMEQVVGTTWGDYVMMLQTNAMTLQSVGADAGNASDLLQLTVQTVSGDLNPYSTVAGVTDLSVAISGDLSLNYSRFYSNRIDDRGWHTNWEYSLRKDDNSAVTFYSPETGVYTFRQDAYGKYFCENDTDVTLKFKGSQAIVQDPANERTWTLDRVDAQNWRLAQVADTHGNTIQLGYDKDGNLAKLASGDGEFILVSKAGLTGSNGISVAYAYSAGGQLIGASRDDGADPYAYRYEGDGLVGVYRGDELVASYVYDENGSVVQTTQGDLVTNVVTEQPGVITVTDNCGHSYTGMYYADGNLAFLTDNVSGEWLIYQYDENGYPRTISSSSGLSEAYVFNANGDMLRYTDPYGNTSSYTYFQGHLKTAVNAAGYSVNVSYDQDWNITQFVCGDGSVITFDYDENGNMTGITDPLGGTMTFDYDDSRRISKVALGDYSYTKTYDNIGNIASITRNGHTTFYEYNTSGLLTSLTDANGNQARMTYDGGDRLTQAIFADGSSLNWGYDKAGKWVSSTTRAGDVIAYTWSPDGLLTGTAVAGTQYQYAYNNDGLLTSAIGADSVQNLAFEYDAHGNLTGLTYKDGTVVSVEPDATCKVASYTIGGQTFAYAWQGGRMSTVSVNGTEFASYTRNSELNLTSGSGIAYEYDALNNITKVGDTTYTYNAVSQIVTKSSAEGVWTYTYDLDGNLTGEKLGDGSEINYAYTYDAAGNRLTKTDAVSGVTTAWTYGAMNQVLTVKVGTGEAVEYAYDLNGNLLSDGRASYTWTEDSRMATMTVGDTTWTYTYNALGYRDSASDGADTYTFYYDGSGNLLAQYRNGAAYQIYIQGATGIEGYVDAEGAVYTFTYDLGGSVTAVTGSNGKSATYAYDAFGNIIAQTGDITDNALTWHGHFGTLANPDGSYYVLARNYSASDGRFISIDPSWFSDGANFYAYAYNDPVNYLDLDGMAGEKAGAPTKQEGNSFPEQLASGKWLENLFPFLKDKTAEDLMTNVPTNGPKIGTGESPELEIKIAEEVIDKATPKGCDAVGDYYKGGLNVAKTLYEKGTISTKDGTVWPSKFATELDDKYLSHFFERYQNATTREAKEDAVQMAWRRWHQLHDKDTSNSAKPNGGKNATTTNTQSASSHDPNDKVSTEGVTDLHCVPDGTRLEYTVLFENDPENATAPARKVYVRDVMDDHLDLDTFLLHSFTLAGHTFQLPDGRDSFNDTVVLDLDGSQITVAVAINLDGETRELTASFTAIDPETGFELQDLTKGVLLINDESGRGEGNLNYSIRALEGLPDNTQITNTAEIFFDFNDPIETPTTINTVDAAPPSDPTDLKAVVAGRTVTLSWTASTDISGVKGYVVRYSHGDQEFEVNTTAAGFVIEDADPATWNWSVQAFDNIGYASEVAAGEAFTVSEAVRATKSDINGNGISDVMFVWAGTPEQPGNYQHGYWLDGTNTWQSAGVGHPAEWENLGCHDMTGDGKADSVLVGNVVVNEVKGAYIGFYADANWVNIGYLNNADDIAWKNTVGDLTGGAANSIVWYAPELYALGAWTDGTDSWTTISNSFGGDDWTLVGCGDFNGDGKDSVVMSGLGGQYFYTADLDGTVTSMGSANWSGWEVRAIGDFSGDGKDDLVLFHPEYGSMVMLADGNLDDFKSIGQLDASDWFVVGAGDYNGDTRDDLLVRQYSTGMLGYYSSGDTTQWNTLGYGVSMEWTVIA